MTDLFAQLNQRLQRVRGVRQALELEVASTELATVSDRIVAHLSVERSFAEFAVWLLDESEGAGLTHVSLRAAHAAYASGGAPAASSKASTEASKASPAAAGE